MTSWFDTRGFAAWLLARPGGWEIRATALPRLLSSGASRVGREKAQRFLRELERAASLTRNSRERELLRERAEACAREPTRSG